MTEHLQQQPWAGQGGRKEGNVKVTVTAGFLLLLTIIYNQLYIQYPISCKLKAVLCGVRVMRLVTCISSGFRVSHLPAGLRSCTSSGFRVRVMDQQWVLQAIYCSSGNIVSSHPPNGRNYPSPQNIHS